MRQYGDWGFTANDLRLVSFFEGANEVIALFTRCFHWEKEGVRKFFQFFAAS